MRGSVHEFVKLGSNRLQDDLAGLVAGSHPLDERRSVSARCSAARREQTVICHELPDAAHRQADGRLKTQTPRQGPFTTRGRLHVLAIDMDRANRQFKLTSWLNSPAPIVRPTLERFPHTRSLQDFFHTPPSKYGTVTNSSSKLREQARKAAELILDAKAAECANRSR